MPRKIHTVEHIIGDLREAKVALAKGQTVAQVCWALGMTEQTYYRWRSEDDGLKVDQAKWLKELERENARLKRAVAELTLEKLILKEAAEGNWSAPSVANSASTVSVPSRGSLNGARAGWSATLARPRGGARSWVMTKRLSPKRL